MFDSIRQDLRVGLRVLMRSPGFTLVGLATLALGIGMTTTMFSFVDAVLLKPLPYEDADRIVRVLETRPSGATSWFSTLNYLDWKAENTVFETLAARQRGLATITGRDEPLPVNVGRVSANFFDVFGTEAYLGRLFVQDEDAPGNERVIVLSHGLWQAEYGGNSDLIGDSILLDDVPYVVIGVLPEHSAFDRSGYDVWHPLALQSLESSRSYRWLNVAFGLLRPGVSLAQARSQMQAIGARLASEYPDSNRGWSVAVDRYADTIVASPLRTSLLVLMTAVAGLLLICCANLASLVLARAVSRSDEVAIRVSLGATAARITQQFFCENFLLATSGSVLGVGFAWAGVAWIGRFVPQNVIPKEAEVVLDARVLAFAVVVAIASSLVFGLLPLVRATRTNIQTPFNDGKQRGSTVSRRTRQLLDGMVVAEVALSVVLVFCATLLVRSFVGLINVDTGFDTRNALTMRLPVPGFPPGSVYGEPAEFQSYVREILTAVGAVPGVSDVAMTTALPLTDCCLYQLNVQIEGKPAPDRADRGGGFFKIVTPSYFRALGLHLVNGRFLNDRDNEYGRPVIVINRRLADRYFAGENPIGQRILNPEILPGRTQRGALISWEIVGVVENETTASLDDEESIVAYASYEQSPAYFANLIVTSRQEDAALLERGVRNALGDVNGSQSILDVRTLEQLRSASAGDSRFQAILLGSFSTVALVFASVGLFGLLAYSVAQRSREMGIRAAIGATQINLLTMVLRRGVGVTAVGLAIGLIVTYTTVPLMEGILYGVDPRDPYLLASVCAAFVVVSVLASVAPALRAARVDPNAMLRSE